MAQQWGGGRPGHTLSRAGLHVLLWTIGTSPIGWHKDQTEQWMSKIMKMDKMHLYEREGCSYQGDGRICMHKAPRENSNHRRTRDRDTLSSYAKRCLHRSPLVLTWSPETTFCSFQGRLVMLVHLTSFTDRYQRGEWLLWWLEGRLRTPVSHLPS